jgi:chromosome partitioning protein
MSTWNAPVFRAPTDVEEPFPPDGTLAPEPLRPTAPGGSGELSESGEPGRSGMSAGSDPGPDDGWQPGSEPGSPEAEPAPAQPELALAIPTPMGEDATEPVQPEVPLGPTQRPRVTFPDPPVLDRHGPARVIAMCSQKGGVGKTTSTINLGAALAEFGRRVLVVDLDPQGALSAGLGVHPRPGDPTVYDLLMDPTVSVDDVMLKTSVAGLDLLPSTMDLAASEVQLVNEVAREQILAQALAPVLPEYDFVLIDCQPSLGLLTINALTAAHGVIIPLESEYFSLRGVALVTETMDKVRRRLNPQLELEGILATMFDSRTLHAREVLARVVEKFGDGVFHTVITRTVRFPETTVAGEPITSYAPSSTGARAYRELAKEVLAR